MLQNSTTKLPINIEKERKSPVNIITGLSADKFVWLRAERYFYKQACTKCLNQHCHDRSGSLLIIMMLNVTTRRYPWNYNTAVRLRVRDDPWGSSLQPITPHYDRMSITSAPTSPLIIMITYDIGNTDLFCAH